jgi:hypothetical protein
MTKKYLILPLFLLSIVISIPFMDAYSQAALLKINELELDPPGPQTAGGQWIEIYNPGNTLLDISGFLIKGIKSGRTLAIASGIVIEPNGYLVIPFEARVFEERAESIVLLSPDSVEINRTPTLSDESNDDRTWQRFPNGIDTGNMTDWSFRNATFAVTNGFPVFRPNFTLSNPLFVDSQGNRVDSFVAGQMVGVQSEIINRFADERTFAYIVQVKDEEGIPVFIAWVENLVLLPNRTIKPTIFFLAEARGEFTVDVFIWRSMTLPDPLTPPTHGLIRVAG